MKKQTKIGLLILSIVVIVFVGLGVFLLIQPQQSIQSYAECIKDKDSVMQTSYPTVCVTKDKKRFTNPSEAVTEPK